MQLATPEAVQKQEIFNYQVISHQIWSAGDIIQVNTPAAALEATTTQAFFIDTLWSPISAWPKVKDLGYEMWI